jgi:hypothetical protein
MFLSVSLTCTDVNGRDSPKPKPPNVRPKRDTISSSLPMFPCRQHGLTSPTGYGNQGSSNLCRGPLTWCTPPHTTGFTQVFGLQQVQTPPKFAVTSFFLSKCLTCYTDVESNGRDALKQNPNWLPNATYRQDTHAL